MSAVIQLVDSGDSKPMMKAQAAMEKAREAPSALNEAHKRAGQAASEWRPLFEAREQSKKKGATLKEHLGLASLELELEPAMLAIGKAIKARADTKPHRAKLRHLEDGIEDGRWQVAAWEQDVKAASDAVNKNGSDQSASKSAVALAEKHWLACEREACLEALIEIGEAFDARIRDLAGEEAFRKFRLQGIAAMNARHGR
jgi:hypothetical protein